MKSNYENDEEFRKYTRSLAALSFIRPERVSDFYDILREASPPPTHKIFDYFRRTYIVRDNGAQPLFPVATWNHYQSVLENMLIIVLKEEERIAQDRIRTYELDPTLGLTMRSRRKQYMDNDRAIRTLVVNFDANANPTPEQVINHLRALQYRLASNGFDNWDN
uniref:Uncharacterized protein n=1 Tax=Meloidogyne floridensis TaxID=298350 RepID=A0A915NBT4_9BILA